MRRRFPHYIARILVVLAIVFPTIPVATAQSADAVLRTLAPSSARPGDEILIEGAGVPARPVGILERAPQAELEGKFQRSEER